jgi:hypothetical protein
VVKELTTTGQLETDERTDVRTIGAFGPLRSPRVHPGCNSS